MTKTIMIVDDEQVVVDIARRKLTDLGYKVIGAYDGEEALRASRENLIDLILLDVEMPNMNGYTFMTEMDKVPAGKRPPVVVLTAHQGMEPVFRRHGVASYLVKPLRIEDILSKIREVLGESAPDGPGHPSTP